MTTKDPQMNFSNKDLLEREFENYRFQYDPEYKRSKGHAPAKEEKEAVPGVTDGAMHNALQIFHNEKGEPYRSEFPNSMSAVNTTTKSRSFHI